jgi:hypothetical protein
MFQLAGSSPRYGRSDRRTVARQDDVRVRVRGRRKKERGKRARIGRGGKGTIQLPRGCIQRIRTHVPWTRTRIQRWHACLIDTGTHPTHSRVHPLRFNHAPAKPETCRRDTGTHPTHSRPHPLRFDHAPAKPETCRRDTGTHPAHSCAHSRHSGTHRADSRGYPPQALRYETALHNRTPRCPARR